MKYILSLLALLAPLASAHVAKHDQTVKLPFKHSRAQFVFESTSPITYAKAHCECTTLKVEGKKIIATVDTTIFDQDAFRTISIRTQEGKSQTLTMRFVVPQALTLSAKSLRWARGSAPKAQSLRLRIPQGSPITALTEAGLKGKEFHYELKTHKKGRDYEIIITPLSCNKKVLNRLVIKTNASDPRYKQFIIYLQVK